MTIPNGLGKRGRRNKPQVFYPALSEKKYTILTVKKGRLDMKKVFAMLLALAMMFSLAACGGKTTGESTPPPDTGASNSPAWPGSDVTVYVPAAAGGGTDIFARTVADYLQRSTGKNFTVVNVEAGSGMVGFEQLRNSAPDGSSIMFWHAGFYVTHFTGQYEYNPNTDFSPLVMFAPEGNDGKQVFVVKGDSKWDSLADLLSDAKTNPGTITYGCAAGGSAQMVAEMLMQAGDAELRLVDASSQTDKITGVAGGNIDVSAITLASALQYVDAGDLKILAVVDKEGTDDYKSAYELGYENCYWSQNLCVYGPAGMDGALCKEINAAFAGLSEDETARATLETAKMLNLPQDYEASLTAFQDYEKTVSEVVATMQ